MFKKIVKESGEVEGDLSTKGGAVPSTLNFLAGGVVFGISGNAAGRFGIPVRATEKGEVFLCGYSDMTGKTHAPEVHHRGSGRPTNAERIERA